MYVYSSHAHIYEYIRVHICWYVLNNAMQVRLEMSTHRAEAL